MIRTTVRLFPIAFVIIALLLAACAPATTSAPTIAPAAQQPTPTPRAQATAVPTPLLPIKLKVAYSAANPDPLAIWVAQDADFLKKNGLGVAVLFISGGGNTAKAPLSGDVQIAALAPSSIVKATAAGSDLVMIAGLVNTINYDRVVQPNITKGEDLKGTKGAVSGPTRGCTNKLPNLKSQTPTAGRYFDWGLRVGFWDFMLCDRSFLTWRSCSS